MELKGDTTYYEKTVWPRMDVILDMQRRGLPVDMNRLRELGKEYVAERDEADAEIRRMTGLHDLNMNAPRQRAALLHKTLGFPVVKRTDSGDPSSDQSVLDKLWRKCGKRDDRRPILARMFHRSKVNTIVSRYIRMHPKDGRVYPTVKFCGTPTERLAYSGPPLQQFPKVGQWVRIRSVIRARPGYVFVAADYSQLEARILAILSGDEPSLAAFARGEDIHEVNTCDLLGYERKQVKFDTTAERYGMSEKAWEGARNYGKSFLYKISYGGQADLLEARVFCPCDKCSAEVPPMAKLGRDAARAAGERWFAKHSAVQRFRAELERQVGVYHYWQSPLGGKRWVFAPWKDAMRMAYNLPMQWIASQIMHRSMARLHHHEAPMILQMHDDIVLEVTEATAGMWQYILRETMERPVPELGGAVFPVDVRVGERWSDL
jgi:DNA polymerase-1